MDYIKKLSPCNNYDNLKLFFRNSVLSIPIITFIIGICCLDKYLILLTIGIIISGIINYTIKKILAQFKTNIFLRPKKAKGCSACCNEKPANHKVGFPSGHSQIIWFFSTYLFLYSYYKYNSIMSLPILFILAKIISLSRLGWIPEIGTPCHTLTQVIFGALLGIITAYYYFNIIYF
jgi:membrane-associated phospholipid phosphatase